MALEWIFKLLNHKWRLLLGFEVLLVTSMGVNCNSVVTEGQSESRGENESLQMQPHVNPDQQIKCFLLPSVEETHSAHMHAAEDKSPQVWCSRQPLQTQWISLEVCIKRKIVVLSFISCSPVGLSVRILMNCRVRQEGEGEDGLNGGAWIERLPLWAWLFSCKLRNCLDWFLISLDVCYSQTEAIKRLRCAWWL